MSGARRDLARTLVALCAIAFATAASAQVYTPVVPAFVPPAVYPAVPKNKARLRFCVISEHKPEQIVQALDTLVELAQELHITLPAPAGAEKA